MKRQAIHAVDLFAGAGGMSTGLALACKALGRPVDLLAINHWKEAVETHEKNHPWARHRLSEVQDVDPRKEFPGGRVNILTAGPECTHHSRAAGGRPLNDQSRASAWYILRWLELLRVDTLLVENVPEFKDWGPLGADRRPIKRLKGTVYEAWLHAIKAFGYNVDTRILNAADYGSPTSRSRFFLMARRGNKAITWPEPTHSKKGRGNRKWRAAREIIDWSIEGESIFARKRPLKPRTIARIIEGLNRFGGAELKPFIVLMEQSGRSGPMVKSVDDPLPTITTAKGGSMALADPRPFILSQGSNGAPKSVDQDPVPAITTGGKHALIEPFILSQGSGGAPRSVEDPMATIPGKGAHSLIVPFFGEGDGQRPRAHSVDEPLPAVTSHGAGGIAEAFIVEYHAGKDGNGDNRVSSIDSPLKTIDTGNRFALAKPFILPVEGYFHKEGQNAAKSEPEVNGRRLDIKFRMLQPHELAGAMGFPSNYSFSGTKTEVVKQIGNAVAVDVAKALCLSLLTKPRKGI